MCCKLLGISDQSRCVVMGGRGYFMMIFELRNRFRRIFKDFKLLSGSNEFLLWGGGGGGGSGRGKGIERKRWVHRK